MDYFKHRFSGQVFGSPGAKNSDRSRVRVDVPSLAVEQDHIGRKFHEAPVTLFTLNDLSSLDVGTASKFPLSDYPLSPFGHI